MISVSDILKILDQIPVWKSLAGLPKRLADLEARVAAMEGRASAAPRRAGPRADECPTCGGKLRVTLERRDPDFGPMGQKIHEMICDGCGTTTERHWSPQSGYE
jgi:hypothetical protein